MTGHDDLLARADGLAGRLSQLGWWMDADMIADLVAALRAVQADREIADTALENTREAVRAVLDRWEDDEAGGSAPRVRATLYPLRRVLADVPAADTATQDQP